MEELIFLEETSRTPRGEMFTNGPGNYKIPCFSDVPIELNVSLLKGSPNKRAIYSSRVCHRLINTVQIWLYLVSSQIAFWLHVNMLQL